LQRHGISRLPEVGGDKPAKKRFKRYPRGGRGISDQFLGRVDKRDSQSVTAMIQGWKLGANHDPRPDRHRSLGADRPVPAA
jgi:hypothetical protein